MKRVLYLFLVSLPLLTFSCRSTYLAKIEPELYGIGSDSIQVEDADINALIAPYKQELDATMDAKIGEAPEALPKARPESPLGNWLGDAVQVKAEAIFQKEVSFSFLNYGGIRVPALPQGAITKRHIYELMPFDNILVLVPANLYGNTQYLDPVATANKYATLLRKEEKCDYVICLSHLGYRHREDKVSDEVLARNSEHIDLIIGGHTHTFLNKPVVLKNKQEEPVIINQVGWAGIMLGRLDIFFERNRKGQCISCENIFIK